MAAKFKVFRSVIAAYRLAWDQRESLIRIAWPMAAILFAVTLLGSLAGWQLGLPTAPGKLGVTAAAIGMAGFLVYLFIAVPVTTGAYRLLMNGPGARTGYAYRREEWLYVTSGLRVTGRMLLWFLAAAAVIGLLAAIAGMATSVTEAFGLRSPLVLVLLAVCGAAAMLALVYVAMRYSLVLPAAALGRRMALAESARMMSLANAWRLLRATAVALLPLLVIAQIISAGSMPHMEASGRIASVCFDCSPADVVLSVVGALIADILSVADTLLSAAVVVIFCRTLELDIGQAPAPPHSSL